MIPHGYKIVSLSSCPLPRLTDIFIIAGVTALSAALFYHSKCNFFTKQFSRTNLAVYVLSTSLFYVILLILITVYRPLFNSVMAPLIGIDDYRWIEINNLQRWSILLCMIFLPFIFGYLRDWRLFFYKQRIADPSLKGELPPGKNSHKIALKVRTIPSLFLANLIGALISAFFVCLFTIPWPTSGPGGGGGCYALEKIN